MRVHVCAVGRMRAGPELRLLEDYMTRFERTGRALGIGAAKVLEVEARKGGGQKAEAELLVKAIPKGSLTLALDERGKTLSSPEFAGKLANWRDDGRSDLAILIGGADGIAPDLRAQTDFSISFGKMVWPHMLARVMLAEQLYRATTILAGTPYHRC
ncbi:MAG: 23S rRNA (pseudouridine(1915)-N(3))-methyltransferase RlmH [Pseudomonadota bacterium]